MREKYFNLSIFVWPSYLRRLPFLAHLYIHAYLFVCALQNKSPPVVSELLVAL